MSYEYITKYDSPNFGYSNDGSHPHGQNHPEFIVIHHWGSEGQAFMTPVNYLCRSNGNSSAHYVVEAGRVACIVDCNDAAWHVAEAGKYGAYVNTHSIGIECRPECRDGDFETVAELIADIWKVYGKLPLKGHQDFNSHGYPTGCPGKWYPRLKELYKRAEVYYNGGNKPTPKPEPKPEPKKVYHVQVGAFETKAYAENMKKELQSKGYKAFIVES